VSVRKRIAEILQRYGPDHVVSCTIRLSAPFHIDLVKDIEHCRLARATDERSLVTIRQFRRRAFDALIDASSCPARFANQFWKVVLD
jgi:hypothetical protein